MDAKPLFQTTIHEEASPFLTKTKQMLVEKPLHPSRELVS